MGKQNNTDRVPSNQVSRRKFLSGIVGLVAAATGAGRVSRRTRAENVSEPNRPDTIWGSEWSDTESLGSGRRGQTIEWDGYRVSHTELRNEFEEQIGSINVPLWRLYAWRLNVLDEPPEPDDDDDDGWIPSIGIDVSVGPLDASTSLDEIAEVLFDSDEYVSQTATEVFADQLEADYPFTSVDDCDDGWYESGVTGCSWLNQVDHTNPSADIEAELTFSSEEEIEVDGSDYTIDYRAFFVVKTYEVDRESDVGRTYVAAGSVFPDEIESGWFDDDFEHDYDYITTSREFLKSVR